MPDISGLPQVTLKFDPAGPSFAISEEATMPVITVTAQLQNVAIDPRLPPPVYTWQVELTFNGATCPHGSFCRTSHSAMAPISGTKNSFVIPFKEVRGGALRVDVSVLVGGRTLIASSPALEIVGTDPSIGRLAAYANPDATFRKIMRKESGLHQFIVRTGYPNFSRVDVGGIGLCQVTNPPPSADDVWNWKANVDSGWRLFREKRRNSVAFWNDFRKHEFPRLVERYNDARALTAVAPSSPFGQPPRPSPLLPDPSETSAAAFASLMPQVKDHGVGPLRRKRIAVTLPALTDEQMGRDILRGFNGYACELHEYRVVVDATGMLVVDESADGLSGVARWEQVSPAERIKVYDHRKLPERQRGDPYYVDKVEDLSAF